MKRRYDWRSRLHKTLATFQGRPFEWGKSDCLTFAKACVEAMTGEVVMPAITPSYTDANGAVLALREMGKSFDAFLAELFPRVHPAYAQEGDIAIIDGSQFSGITGIALGIVLGERIGCLTERGYGTIPRKAMKGAFAVR